MSTKSIVREKMDLAFTLFVRASLFLLISLVAGPRLAVTADNSVKLKLIVTDCYGTGVLNSSVQVIPEHTGTVKYIKYPEKEDLDISPGAYTVVVSAQGFFTTARSLLVSTRDMFFPVCLELSPIEITGHERPPTLIGRVSKDLLSGGVAWVRLVGMYFDLNATELVSKESLTENGAFSFAGLRPGRYFLLMFDEKGLKVSGPVDVRAFGTTVFVSEKGIASER